MTTMEFVQIIVTDRDKQFSALQKEYAEELIRKFCIPRYAIGLGGFND